MHTKDGQLGHSVPRLRMRGSIPLHLPPTPHLPSGGRQGHLYLLLSHRLKQPPPPKSSSSHPWLRLKRIYVHTWCKTKAHRAYTLARAKFRLQDKKILHILLYGNEVTLERSTHFSGSSQPVCRQLQQMRHEILNEKERQIVYDDILEWCDDKISV